MELYEKALKLHEENRGKIEIAGKVAINNKDDLSLAYSPGVAEPCRRIAQNPELAYTYTAKGNMVAVVTDGTAVLGLGNIGPEAALPVMEGKALLFKNFAGIDGIPICLNTTEVDEIVAHVKGISPTFGGINLEDISGPRCFEIEERLVRELDIPVFHDDQHGTAVVMFAGLLNALKLVKKSLDSIRVVVVGAGAAGTAIAKLLQGAGVSDLIVCDRFGIISESRNDLDHHLQGMLTYTNPNSVNGELKDAVKDADVLIGVAAANVVSEEMVTSMAKDAIVFALANPDPEISPESARRAGARVIATGRSDYPNQVNNVLGFPGIFRGALDVRASRITENMKLAAANGIANLVAEAELSEEYIIPAPFDSRVVPAVAEAVAKAAIADGVARISRR